MRTLSECGLEHHSCMRTLSECRREHRRAMRTLSKRRREAHLQFGIWVCENVGIKSLFEFFGCEWGRFWRSVCEPSQYAGGSNMSQFWIHALLNGWSKSLLGILERSGAFKVRLASILNQLRGVPNLSEPPFGVGGSGLRPYEC